MLFKWPWFGKQLSCMWANLPKQHIHFRPGEIAILFIQPILSHSCFSVLPQTHPNRPPFSPFPLLEVFLSNANNSCLATKYSPWRNLLDYYFFPSFTFLRERERESEREREREKDIFVISSLQIPVVHKQWCAFQMKCTTLCHVYRGKPGQRHHGYFRADVWILTDLITTGTNQTYWV